MRTLRTPRIVYKGAWSRRNYQTGKVPVLVVLQLPVGAQVRLPLDNYDKNRASAAKVLSIESPDGLTQFEEAYARGDFKYTVGKTVKPERPFSKNGEECASGIHFFLTRRDALHWVGVRGSTDPQYAASVDEVRVLKGQLSSTRASLEQVNNRLNAANSRLRSIASNAKEA